MMVIDMNIRVEQEDKQKRNRDIFGYYAAHPDVTMADIARLYGLSNQRVHFIIQRQCRKDTLSGSCLLKTILRRELSMASDFRERLDDDGNRP